MFLIKKKGVGVQTVLRISLFMIIKLQAKISRVTHPLHEQYSESMVPQILRGEDETHNILDP